MPASPEAGERRQLTVLFSDLVGSTALSGQLDPEEWRDQMARYHCATAAVVARFGGTVAKYLGDGVLALFGYPRAHEDDAERAVRAGLEIADAVRSLSTEPDSAPKTNALSVRIGIHTGLTVIGDVGGTADVFGETPNVAARVQNAADPDTVVMTAATQHLVAGLFVVEDRGAQPLKGIEQPVQLYRVLGVGVVGTRARRRMYARGVTPFVGREDELRLLASRWERAREGEGQVVLVIGEPGIGKSRLVEEFRAHIAANPHLWIAGAGEQFVEHTPFHSVIQMLDQGLGWRGNESKDERLSRLERALELAGLNLSEAVPLIAEMLALPIPGTYPPLVFAPDQRRRRLFAALVRWVLAATKLQPLVLVLEDLHWIDPSTLELLEILVAQGATVPLLLLATARPEFRAPWPMRAHHAQITLNRLSAWHMREIVASLVSGERRPETMTAVGHQGFETPGSQAKRLDEPRQSPGEQSHPSRPNTGPSPGPCIEGLPADVVDALVRRTDGVPLFAEELTRLLLEGHGHGVGHEVPATLRDSLTARLDRLGRAKEVAQLGAVLGREFSYELLRAVSLLPDGELQAALTQLADADLLYARGLPPEATYQFKHALIQDAAYEGLLKSTRRELHRRVAQALSERFPSLAAAQPQVLARHWSDAGEAEPALAAWTTVARAADAGHAYKEAEEAYRQALAMLAMLPASAERDARELELTFALYLVLSVTKGHSAPEAVEAATRTRTLAETGGNLPQLFLEVVANFVSAWISGAYVSATALADELLDLARREGSDASRRDAYSAQFMLRFYRGDLVGAEEHYARWRSVCEASGYLQFPGATTTGMGIAAMCAWMLGHADTARVRIAQAAALGRESGNPYEVAIGLAWESWLCAGLRAAHSGDAAAAQAVALCDEHGLTQLGDWARVRGGWARAHLGRTDEGIALMRQGIAGLVETGACYGMTWYLTALAEAQALAGAVADALTTVEDALTANPEELVFRPQALTCRGNLRLALGQRDLAEADFRDAIVLARTMQAKAWELRATTHLGRLLRDTGRRKEAGTLLAEIYGWFTEGFDTVDLQEAKALLEELGG